MLSAQAPPPVSQGLLLASVPLHMLSVTPRACQNPSAQRSCHSLWDAFLEALSRWEEALIFLRGWAVS